MEVRVNWRQGKIASDKLVRVHRILDRQPALCQFRKMKEYNDFSNEKEAKEAIKSKGYLKYKRCAYGWDGAVVEIQS